MIFGKSSDAYPVLINCTVLSSTCFGWSCTSDLRKVMLRNLLAALLLSIYFTSASSERSNVSWDPDFDPPLGFDPSVLEDSDSDVTFGTLSSFPEHDQHQHSPSNGSALSEEEFNDILTRFSIDALQAAQIADRLGLVKELESPEVLVDKYFGGSSDEFMENESAIAQHFREVGPDQNYKRPRRGLSKAARRFFLGDQEMCYSGTCEFFLMCWVGGGLIEGGCGGFLFACCSRGSRGRGGSSYRDASSQNHVPRNYGPVKNDPSCGITSANRIGAQRRIVGGTEAGFGSFPWQAYIRIGSSRCGGSLINKYHVVTAGHCVARARPNQVRVTLGDYVLNSKVEPLRAKIYNVVDIKVHPLFKFTPQADRFDVAVIRLETPVQYEPHIHPICLPEKGRDWLGFYGWAAGWGALESGSRLRPKTLQVVDVPVVNSQLCEDWHRQKGINVVIYDEMMCAGYGQGNKDSCQGDSGGPLMIQNEGRWYLAGIVSAGYSCARPRQPGIYHRVSSTSDWISWAAST
ncbi:Serine proteinase stubble [Armadillidium nasatum]|uniref:Serine proteinase stubble n=1 Tax=Armadillidium nasatum TaxID=96803 RepID=A0A5N5TMF6_9CRUS|nr:Serine proteinase stubble [Armadillidium nasatum]